MGREWVTVDEGRAAVPETPFDESERRTWAGSAEAYAAGFARLCAYPVPRLLDAAGVGEGTRVLDVGTGTGSVAAAARARAARVTAVDAEPEMVRSAARAVPDADVRTAALPHLPFPDGEFDAVIGNFVLNHVGRPAAALRELRRVTAPGGRIALTIWAAPAAPGQALLGRAVQAAGAVRPAHLPTLAPEDDFPRTAHGLATLLRAADLAEVTCRQLSWNHRTTIEEWWRGPAAGVASIGQIVISQPPAVIERIRHQLGVLAEEFMEADGRLVLPHSALLAVGAVG
ncbi:methyltransferase domain-containing protein [Streptomyces piniterrae]|uniref:Methyltransferase domain-containing protein n=1 Tax=Streptomyces piniterrae TaxID=2571125 RepID=A0A4V5ML66_9ACTN|nr:class I SAM-dependent methyltransferase [Streptomyces piniterrae]TJZ54518.1 methyltransferase domain-containing protein [Streptomyces piniterrae]